MKIAITAQGNDRNAKVDPRFGRCPYFLIVDLETDHIEVVENQSVNAGGGAGIQAAKTVADKGVQAVLTGNVGPNAFSTLNAAGIEVCPNVSGTIADAIDLWKSGSLKAFDAPSVQAHHGMAAQKSTAPSSAKRVAVASEDDRLLDAPVSAHFGRCPYYTIVTLDGDRIQGVESVENPFYNAHGQPGQVPAFIRDQKANVIIAGGMGQRAAGFFQEFGIDAVTGATGSVSAAVKEYLSGTIQGTTPCNHSH